MANGECVPYLGVFRGTPLYIDDKAFQVTYLLVGCDIMLGTQWLMSLAPILWDFGAITVSFWHQDHHVNWHGVASPPNAAFQTCTGNNHMEALLAVAELLRLHRALGNPPHTHEHHITMV